MSPVGRFCCKSRQRPRVGGPLVMWVGFDPPISAALRNFDATQCAKPEREAVVRPAPRTVAGFERWRPEQTHPGHLAGRAVGADRASGCASSVRTSSRSFCADRLRGKARERERRYHPSVLSGDELCPCSHPRRRRHCCSTEQSWSPSAPPTY
jgi:hypothetical protein